MAKKKKEPIVNKMYVWELEYEGQTVQWKCFVGEDECITYEGDQEIARLPIENKTQEQGVLQINTKTKVFDETTKFQLENGVPYIKLIDENGDRKWIKSDTTLEDTLQARVRQVKKEAYTMGGLSIVMALITVIDFVINGQISEWNFLHIFAVIFLLAAGMNLVKLRNELLAMGRTFSFKL